MLAFTFPRALAALCVVGVLLGCVPGAADQSRAAPITLKVATPPNITNAPLYVADAEGYFAEQNITIEFVKIARTPDGLPPLLQGGVDVLVGTVSIGLLSAIAREDGVKIVGDRGYVDADTCVYSALIARKALVDNGELAGVAQLRGKRIAFNMGGFEQYFVERVLAEGGLNLDDITVVDIPDAAEPQALKDGSIDLAYSSEPALTQVVETGDAVLWKTVQQTVPGFQFGVLVYGANLLQQNPDAGMRFMAAYLKAVQRINRGKLDRDAQTVSAHLELDPALVSRVGWSTFRKGGNINAESLVDFQNWAVERGLLDAAVGPQRFWEPRFVDRANQMLEKIS